MKHLAITYVGSFESVELKDPKTNERWQCKRGEAIEVPEELAREKLKLPDWKAATKTEKKAADRAEAKADAAREDNL